MLFSSEYVSLAVAYVAYMFYLAGVRHPRLSHFLLHVADFMSGIFPQYLDRTFMLWTNTYPLTPIAGFLGATLLLVALSGLLTTREDR